MSLVCKMQLVFEAYLWLMPIAICRWRCVNIARMRCGDLRGKTNAKRGADRRRGSASGFLFFLPRNPQLDEVLPRGFCAVLGFITPPRGSPQRHSNWADEKRAGREQMASLARLTIIKKNGSLGGVCPMDTKELIIGRRAPLQHSHPAPLPELRAPHPALRLGAASQQGPG